MTSNQTVRPDENNRMSDDGLDELLARFGDGYNQPRETPPLDEIRSRIHARRASASRRNSTIAGALVAIAAGLLIAMSLGRDRVNARSSTTPVALQPAASPPPAMAGSVSNLARARATLNQAIDETAEAANRSPDDTFYREHLLAMRETARVLGEQQIRAGNGNI